MSDVYTDDAMPLLKEAPWLQFGGSPNTSEEDMSTEVDAYNLANTPQYIEAIEIAEELREELRKWETQRELVLEILRKLARDIGESCQKHTIAKVSGASAAAVGSIIAIVGFGLAFFSFGASLALTAVGGGIAAAGGITMAGSGIGNWAVSRMKIKEAKELIEQDKERMKIIHEKAAKLKETVEELHKQHPSHSKEEIFSFIFQVLTGCTLVSNAYKMFDVGTDIARGAVNLMRFGRLTASAASASSVAWAGISTVAGGLSVAGIVVDAVTLPIDFLVIANGPYDIHRYRPGQGTNLRRALKLEAMIEELEKDRDELLKLKEMLEPTTFTSSPTLLPSSSCSLPSQEKEN